MVDYNGVPPSSEKDRSVDACYHAHDMLSERSQHKRSHSVRFYLYEISKNASLQRQKVDQWLAGAGDENGECLHVGMWDLFEVTEYVLQLDGGDMSEFYGM